ncbi:cell wall-binding repeat-containing protein [Paenibacillus filicis]|uniref:Cell wall-binding repeat-containing protein n=1 Tax=Paenibacillus filicis TaxID=669464 RepID=A0ABU9DRT3_9BACL
MMMKTSKWLRTAALLAAGTVLLTGCLQKQESAASLTGSGLKETGSTQVQVPWIATKNTTRINTSDPYEAAVLVSHTLWPAASDGSRPGGVVLVDPDDWRNALVSADLIHHPNNGPVLYAKKDQVPETTLRELKRLQPKGVPENNGVQVILVGEFTEAVQAQLKGYKLDRVTGSNPAALARNIDAYYAKTAGGLPDAVLVGSSDRPEFTLPAVNWIAHMPEPLLYTGKDELPPETAEALQARGGKATIYLLGPESVISASVASKLTAYGKVKRIAGKDAYEQSIAFAKYKDTETGFGWGITAPGHNLSLVAKDSPPALAIAAAPFSHLGKHAPLIWTDKTRLPDAVMSYVMSIQPKFTSTPSDGPFNHAWLTGAEGEITYAAQAELDEMLEIASASGAGHGASHGAPAKEQPATGSGGGSHSGH